MMYREVPPPAPYLVVTLGNVVVAMDRRSGRRMWEWKGPSSSVFSRVLVTDERVVVGGERSLSCVAYATGAPLWSVDCPIYVGTWLHDAGQLFVSGTGEVVCFDLLNGRQVWHDSFQGYGIVSSALGVPGNAAQVDHS